MISGFRKTSGRKHTYKSAIEHKCNGKMTASLGSDESLLKPKRISLTDIDGPQKTPRTEGYKVEVKKGSGVMLFLDTES